MEGIRRAHVRRGASDILCHVYTTPDGTVWPARSPATWNCGCQYPPDHVSWDDIPTELQQALQEVDSGLSWRRKVNAFGFSCETIGYFDRPEDADSDDPAPEDPHTSVAMATSLDVLAMVHEIWNIPVERCFFHRDVSGKTCPGSAPTKAWVHAELRRRLGMPEETPAWAEEAVRWAKENDIVKGYPDGSIGGHEPLTTFRFVVMLKRYHDKFQSVVD